MQYKLYTMYLARIDDGVFRSPDHPDLTIKDDEWYIRNGFITRSDHQSAWILTAKGYRKCTTVDAGHVLLYNTVVLDWRDVHASYYVKLNCENTRGIYCEQRDDRVTEWPLVDCINSNNGCRSGFQTIYTQPVYVSCANARCRTLDIEHHIIAACHSGGIDYAIVRGGEYNELVTSYNVVVEQFPREFDHFDMFEMCDGVIVINAESDIVDPSVFVCVGGVLMYVDTNAKPMCMIALD